MSDACSCVDCSGSCPKAVEYPPLPEPWRIGAMDGLALIMLIIFLCISSAFVLILVIHWRSERKALNDPKRLSEVSDQTEKKEISYSRGSLMERAGASMEKWLESFFTSWGTCELIHITYYIV